MFLRITSTFTFARPRPANALRTRRKAHRGNGGLDQASRGRANRLGIDRTLPEKPPSGLLLAEGLPAVVVNARQVRDFAKAMNYLAKTTDAVDAAIIAHFAEVATTQGATPGIPGNSRSS